MAVAMHSQESRLRRWRDATEELRGITAEAGGIAGDIRRIARDEVALAVEEVQEGIGSAKRAGMWSGVAALFALVTLMWLPLPVVLGLAETMPMWAAALLTASGLLVITIIVGLVAVNRLKRTTLVPRGAIERMKEDREWLSQHLSAGHD